MNIHIIYLTKQLDHQRYSQKLFRLKTLHSHTTIVPPYEYYMTIS